MSTLYIKSAKKGKYMKKKLLIVAFISVMVFAFTACSSSNEQKAEEQTYPNEVGVDDLIVFDIPDKYQEENNGGGEKPINHLWSNDGVSLTLVMLSYDDQPILGEKTLEKNMDSQETFDDLMVGDTKMFISGTNRENTEYYKSDINATFGIQDYVLRLTMQNVGGDPITDEQKEEFYEILKSADFAGTFKESLGEDITDENQKLLETLDIETE